MKRDESAAVCVGGAGVVDGGVGVGGSKCCSCSSELSVWDDVCEWTRKGTRPWWWW